MDHLPDYLLQPGTTEAPPPAPPEKDLPAEAGRILAVLRHHKWHRGRSAKALIMDRTTLWRKIRLYGLDRFRPGG